MFRTPRLAAQRCGAGGTFVKRIVALGGDTWEERAGVVLVNGRRLHEPYVRADGRDTRTLPPRRIPKNHYFMLGDNRIQSCDSREWGSVPRKVFFVYWPTSRIGFR